MANAPFSFFEHWPRAELMISSPDGSQANIEIMPQSIEQLVLDIVDPNRREYAMAELAKKKDVFPDMALILWHSCGTIAALQKEIMIGYGLLSPPTLSEAQAKRICDALALFQCVAAHPDTQDAFLSAMIPQYIYVFLNTTEITKPFEYLRLSSLGVIAALVKVENSEAINFCLSSEVIPLCLKNMEIGCKLSKTVATFIIQMILLDNSGFNHICSNPERFYSVTRVLLSMAIEIVEHPSQHLLKHITCCFLRLSEKHRACDVLKYKLPTPFKDGTMIQYCLNFNDDVTRVCLEKLLTNLQQRLMTQQPVPLYAPPVIN